MKDVTNLLCKSMLSLALLASQLSDASGDVAAGAKESRANSESKRVKTLAEQYVKELRIQALTTPQSSRLLGLAIATHKELVVWNERAKLNAEQELAAMKALNKLKLQIEQSHKERVDGDQGNIDLATALQASEAAVILTVEQKKAREEVARLENELWESIWIELTEEQRTEYVERQKKSGPK